MDTYILKDVHQYGCFTSWVQKTQLQVTVSCWSHIVWKLQGVCSVPAALVTKLGSPMTMSLKGDIAQTTSMHAYAHTPTHTHEAHTTVLTGWWLLCCFEGQRPAMKLCVLPRAQFLFLTVLCPTWFLMLMWWVFSSAPLAFPNDPIHYSSVSLFSVEIQSFRMSHLNG